MNIDRFLEKVKKTDPCWNWIGGFYNTTGYGYFYLNGKQLLAHRAGFELLVGAIPDGLTLDHLCRNKLCVNPKHLEPVTLGVNVLRGNSMGAINARKTTCIRGHAFTNENTGYQPYYKVGKLARYCKICRNDTNKVWKRERISRYNIIGRSLAQH